MYPTKLQINRKKVKLKKDLQTLKENCVPTFKLLKITLFQQVGKF